MLSGEWRNEVKLIISGQTREKERLNIKKKEEVKLTEGKKRKGKRNAKEKKMVEVEEYLRN